MSRRLFSVLGLLCLATCVFWTLTIPVEAKAPTTQKATDSKKVTTSSSKKIKKQAVPTPKRVIVAKKRSATPAKRTKPQKVVAKAKASPKASQKDDFEKEISQGFVKDIWSKGFFIALLLIFVGGFLVSLTPCVYPMIPITIAVIGASTKGEESKRGHSFLLAFIYVIGMALPYMVLGVVVASLGRLPFVLGGAFFGNAYFLGFLVTLFALMSFSMFGAFDLALPSSWQTRLSMFQGKGFLGVFVLGMIGATLATPCSGPVIIGLLAFVAQSGNIFLGAFLPLVFSLGLGVPFLILGGGVVEALPRSGNWMSEVKKVFGVILLGATFFYGRYLVLKLKLDPMIFPMILGVTLILLAVFAGAFRAYSKDTWWWDKLKQVIGILFFIVGLYLFLGSMILKGFLLPSWSELNKAPAPVVVKAAPSKVVAKRDPCLPPANYPLKPFWFTSEKEGARCAKKLKRPMIIDFWATWCTACKKLEKKSFNHPKVVRESRRFVLVKFEYQETRPEDVRLRKKYNIKGLPWVRFIDSKGKLLSKPRIPVSGSNFVGPTRLLKMMRQVH